MVMPRIAKQISRLVPLLCLLGMASSSSAELSVIFDNGRTRPLSDFLGPFDSGKPENVPVRPWTLNIAGQGVYFNNRWQAWRALDQSLRAGQDSVDIGLMQVNWRFHQRRLGNSWLALDPTHNLSVGAEILKDCYKRRRDWWASVGCYHAPIDSLRATRYRALVVAIWRELSGVD